MKKFSLFRYTLIFFTFSLIFNSCSKDYSYSSDNLIGAYNGSVVFQREGKTDTALAFDCTYNFLENGLAIRERISNNQRDTAEWYINDLSDQLTLADYSFFFGITVNDVLLFNADSLIFRGPRFVNINGTLATYTRTVELERR